MRNIFKQIVAAGTAILVSCAVSCTDETLTAEDGTHSDKGTLLKLTATLETEQIQTRVSELEGDKLEELINTGSGKDNKFKHIGLYIYYADDYEKDNLSDPYIRNLRCHISDGKIMPCDENGKTLTGDENKIYIYDRMTIVAFYPYNEEMNLERNFFKKKIDEEAYPISCSNYADQKYIPYRAQTHVNPTNAYYRELGFHVKHTAKIEIVLVSATQANLPTTGDFQSDAIQILPKLDPRASKQTDGNGFSTDTREQWLDAINSYPQNGQPKGGLYAKQYVAYLWTSEQDAKHHDNENNNYGNQGVNGDHNHWDNIIYPNDIVFRSGSITLFSSQQVNLAEQRVYRYGYNMDTGEIFIPTSSQLVYDATSLQEVNCDKTSAYQVCNIDLTGVAWTPKSISDGTFDGGGHEIRGLLINLSSPPSGVHVGLFANINGNSYIRNVDLYQPKITVNGIDSCFVGSICGYINPRLTEDQIKKLENNLPKELSEVVKKELLKDLIAEMSNSTAQIISSRIYLPDITVTGKNARVGGICGAAGDKDEQGNYFAKISDSYTDGGVISVNGTRANADNMNTLAGGICGANNGRILHSYSSSQVIAYFPVSGSTKNNAAELCRKGWFADEFAKEMITPGKPRCQVVDCYAERINEHDGEGVRMFDGSVWPSVSEWVTYTGKWPVYSNDWKDPDEGLDNESGHPSVRSYWQSVGGPPKNYPKLLWENR